MGCAPSTEDFNSNKETYNEYLSRRQLKLYRAMNDAERQHLILHNR